MIAVGCLFPVLLVVAGAIVGGTHGGAETALIGAAIGLVIGAALPAIAFFAFSRLRDDTTNRADGNTDKTR